LEHASQTCSTASHTSVPGHVPHWSACPHPSLAVPHWKPRDPQVDVTHAPQAQPLPFCSHESPTGHVPQLMAAPHSLTITPHVALSSAHVVAGVAHWRVAGLQNLPCAQPPHARMCPHPSW
jgi:hypothetical protein